MSPPKMPRAATVLLWSQFRVRNLPRSLRFYRGLGIRAVRKVNFDDGVQIAFLSDSRNRQRFELFFVPRSSRLYFPLPRSRSIDAGWAIRVPTTVVERMLRRGARAFRDYEVGGERFTQIRDPDGYWVELISPGKEPSS